jgi:hypothetical protein
MEAEARMNPRPPVHWLVILFAPLLTACFQSPQPLGPPTLAVDAAFIGAWTCVDPKDAKNVAVVTTVPFDAHQFYVDWREEPDHVTRYRAFATKVGAETLWNVEELDDKAGSGGFVFMKARLAADRTLSLALVEEDALHGLKGAAALAEIRRRAADASLFGPFASCTPKAAPAPAASKGAR